mmetsp:Transcript_121932/g.289952  ORF Transcript_121932/g.289952 Transcript_121932/m.289952 type:complete len:273 (+) Transcript_121932:296-1114(+)
MWALPRDFSLPSSSSSSSTPTSRSTALMRRNNVCSMSASMVGPTLRSDAACASSCWQLGNQATAGVRLSICPTLAIICKQIGSRTLAFCTSRRSAGTQTSSNFTRSRLRASGPRRPGLTKFSHSKRRYAVPAGAEDMDSSSSLHSKSLMGLSDCDSAELTANGWAAPITVRKKRELVSTTSIASSCLLSNTKNSCISSHSGLVEWNTTELCHSSPASDKLMYGLRERLPRGQLLGSPAARSAQTRSTPTGSGSPKRARSTFCSSVPMGTAIT